MEHCLWVHHIVLSYGLSAKETTVTASTLTSVSNALVAQMKSALFSFIKSQKKESKSEGGK